MFDERAFLDHVETAGLDELARIIRQPSVPEDQTLEVYFGDDRYQRMQELSWRKESPLPTLGNVVVIPGLMGSELSTVDRQGRRDAVWLSYRQILMGRLERLRLGPDGLAESGTDYNATASGILKRFYGVLMLSLSRQWNVRAFCYDWRKDVELAADALMVQIRQWFGQAPVHIVAHSMGGLVARAFLKKYPREWQLMNDPRGIQGGRLVMLGTPNQGAYLIPQALTGLSSTLNSIALLDIRHRLRDVLRITNSFPGTYQMLPSPRAVPGMKPLYDARTYPDLHISADHLDRARHFHDWLADAIDPERMMYVAGTNQPTVTGLKDPRRIMASADYNITRAGDGSVPLSLGPLRNPEGGLLVPTYHIAEEHTRLTENREVLENVDWALRTGRFLSAYEVFRDDRATMKHGAATQPASPELDDPVAHQQWDARRMQVRRRVAELVSQVQIQTESHGPEPGITRAGRELEEALTAGFAGHPSVDF